MFTGGKDMSSTVLMPRNGQSVESCIITKWFKKNGDAVKKGEIIFSYETDKSTFDYESEFEGKILDVYYNEGDEVPVLTAVCVIGDELVIKNEKRIKISPRAMALAEKMGVDFSIAVPSGPNGRIIERDIIALSKMSRPTPVEEKKQADEKIEKEDYEVIVLSGTRKTIAEKMLKSLSNTAQLTLNTSFDATDILEFKKRVNERRDKLNIEKITINDIVLYAVSRTILNHRDLNAHLSDDRIMYFEDVHLGVAVDSERGLMVPTIFNANKKSLNEISGEVKNLAEKCRNGTVMPDLLKGATFTVSNLGMLGIESFTPIINSPQTGILGIDCMMTKVKGKEGLESYYPAIGLSLTFDHRALDGAQAARFLKELKGFLEDFSISFVR